MRLPYDKIVPLEQQRVIFPKWISNSTIGVYFLLLLLVAMAFYNYAMEWYFMFIGAVEIVGFFYFANLLSKKWGAWKSSKKFEHQIFWTAIGIRVVWVIFSYFFYMNKTGIPFGFGAADSLFYDDMGKYGRSLLTQGKFPSLFLMAKYAGRLGMSDYGYPLYLSFVYWLTGDSLIVTRLVKCFLSAWIVVMMYRIAVRNFGEKIGRVTGIICMLMPNLIYYCGLHLKETEMVFLTVAAIDQADQLLRERKFNVWKTLPVVLCIGALFFFRTALAAVVALSLLCALVFSSSRVVSWGKKIIIGLLAISLMGVVVGNKFSGEISELVQQGTDQSQQQDNMQWRAERTGGNSFARYASASVFAPLIFTIPFPTMVATPGQELNRIIHGGNYVKNITSFFTVLAMLMLLFSGEWRKYVLPLSFMLGYLVVLVFSSFAQSERFHMPALCFELMFAAYAICQCGKKERRWFNYWLIFIFVANIGWQWFKLAGRGMV